VFLFAVDGDGSIGTNESAVDAARAIVLDKYGIPITFQIDFFGESETFLGTSCNAELTPLTDFMGDYHITSDHKERSLSSSEYLDTHSLILMPIC